jgi:hypothetical protein
MPKSAARQHVAGRRLATGALLLLALAATLAFGTALQGPNATRGQASATAGARLGDDAHAIAAAPGRSADWAVGQPRGPQGDDRLVAVVLAAALLLVAQAWRRAAFAPYRNRVGRGGHRAPSRAPPAFV